MLKKFFFNLFIFDRLEEKRISNFFIKFKLLKIKNFELYNILFNLNLIPLKIKFFSNFRII